MPAYDGVASRVTDRKVHDVSTIIILPDFPTVDTGGGQRSLLFLDAAAAVGPVHLVVLSDRVPKDAILHLPQVASVESWGEGSLQLDGLLRHVPFAVLRLLAPQRAYQADPDFRKRLDALVDRTGARAVLFRYFRAFAATGLVKRDDLAVLVDIDDRDDQRYADRLARLFGPRLGRAWVLNVFLRNLARMMRGRLTDASLVWFAAPEDVWTVPSMQSVVLPNVPRAVPAMTVSSPPSQGNSILFVGIYSHAPNRDGISWFLNHCWAELSRRFPQTRLRIVGRGMLWHEMAARYTHLERVDFVGFVDDLAAEYNRARLCICPVREGGGSKIKVIEAAAFGRPIVGVPHAFRGFDGGIHDHAAEALTPNDFVEACSTFLSDDCHADRSGAALAEWQRRNYSYKSAKDRIKADILSTVSVQNR